MDQFIQTIIDNIKKGTTIIDIGSGDGFISNEFYKQGAIVKAIDKKTRPANLNKEIVFYNLTLQEFLREKSSEKFDIIFVRNVMQFIDRKEFIENILPKLTKLVNPNGILALATFYAEPILGFDKPLLATYDLKDLITITNPNKILLKRQYKCRSLSLDGKIRMFFRTELILRLK